MVHIGQMCSEAEKQTSQGSDMLKWPNCCTVWLFAFSLVFSRPMKWVPNQRIDLLTCFQGRSMAMALAQMVACKAGRWKESAFHSLLHTDHTALFLEFLRHGLKAKKVVFRATLSDHAPSCVSSTSARWSWLWPPENRYVSIAYATRYGRLCLETRQGMSWSTHYKSWMNRREILYNAK